MTKRILITGKNSYVGQSFTDYCSENEPGLIIDSVSVRGDEWQSLDFTSYDTILHCAGIAHNSSDSNLEDLYYQVNRDLTIAVATKAKAEGVKQFLFMSSMIVFGNHPSGKTYINAGTVPNPDNFYGDSKLQAEIGLEKLQSEDFKIAIVRPPMIYGKGSKGNYPLLAKLAKKSPIFPNYPNKRSMLYIGNLCRFISLVIKHNDAGKFHPQNAEYVQTSEMVMLIAEAYDHKIFMPKSFNFIINKMFRLNIIKKVFGELYYDQEMSRYKNRDYQKFDLKQSIILTEAVNEG
ncbi:NAD-dependent epimerase/dehydratase family protein [Aerococcaceae bacterium DSM 109653]|uniref:NAD-dependent epimerase/dehydratase family protein n=1 Tax=Fundicoccus ignavus TaxID=2664442 RepID=A0A844BTE3_9LACT|nr:NAD-dependent epimerase/dehydratase family protein [Fundicoccus ignavus]MRI80799.1 NAD-dependent epimerase/dehydratase family protein [Fundicoccus ignavus]